MTNKQNDHTKTVTAYPAQQRTTSQVTDPGKTSERTLGSAAFPIVGIGASAGGLEAFELFFEAMPANPGMAFILVAHLDPTHTSILPELVQKKTKMKVHQVTDNMQVQANHVYIIPPNKELAILNCNLQLLEILKPRGANLPIDNFLRTLAQDQGNNATCIILSGTGTDGTLGLRAIKGEAGMVMVQDEKSAKYNGMPRNAIATGLVDYILPPEKMPDQLLKYVRHAAGDLTTRMYENNKNVQNALLKIFILLRNRTGHDFSLYKKNTLFRRVERRMHVHQFDEIAQYVRYLQESEKELSILFKELLIGVTSFFRDTKAFDLLKNTYLPALFLNKPDDYQVRIWVPGCSSGEEVYSIAIIIQECMEAIGRHFNIQIFGTDIDAEAISRARTGIYPDSIAADVGPDRLKKFYIKEDNQFQIKKQIREMVVFAPQNIIKDPPFTKLDMLCCRNLLIYFGPELQKKLLPIFHYSLKTDGILFLGSSESTGQTNDLFTCLDSKWKLFKRISSDSSRRPLLDFPTTGPATKLSVTETPGPPNPVEAVTTLKVLKSLLAHSDMPACVVIDASANILYIHGRTGKFLEPAEGETTNNLIEMARPGLKAGLTNAIHKIASSREEVVINGLQVKYNGGFVIINLIIRPLPVQQTGCPGMMMVIFEPVHSGVKTTETAIQPHQREKSEAVKKLEDELLYTKENLQTTIEQLETSNEELKSTNEELQSTNEELQSTNEELETSKEELQSLNEESTTVNAELQNRMDDMVRANDDIKNLLDATDIASIFLDIDLGVMRFTPKITEIFPLTSIDIGRPIQHFSSSLTDVDLQAYSRKVLMDLGMEEDEVTDAEGKVYRMRVRPYRTTNNVIDGVVITFEDITKIKKIESQLLEISASFEERLLMMSKVFMDGADPIIIEDLNGNILDVNDEAVASYGWNRKELLGKTASSLYPQDSHNQLTRVLEQCRNGKSMRNIKDFRVHKSGENIPVLLTFSLLSGTDGTPVAIATIAKNYPTRSKTA